LRPRRRQREPHSHGERQDHLYRARVRQPAALQPHQSRAGNARGRLRLSRSRAHRAPERRAVGAAREVPRRVRASTLARGTDPHGEGWPRRHGFSRGHAPDSEPAPRRRAGLRRLRCRFLERRLRAHRTVGRAPEPADRFPRFHARQVEDDCADRHHRRRADGERSRRGVPTIVVQDFSPASLMQASGRYRPSPTVSVAPEPRAWTSRKALGYFDFGFESGCLDTKTRSWLPISVPGTNTRPKTFGSRILMPPPNCFTYQSLGLLVGSATRSI